MRWWGALLLVSLGCGRVAFDPRADTAVVDVDPLADGLVIHYRFEDTFPQNIATGEGDLSADCGMGGTLVPGIMGNAVLFDGIDDCCLVVDDPRMHQLAFTIAVIARHNATRGDSIVAKLFGPISGNRNSFQLETGDGFSMPGDSISFTTTATGPLGNDFLESAGGAMSLGVWHHVVATYDGMTKRLYVDGIAISTTQMPADIAFDSGAMTIGCDQNGTGLNQFFDGTIDDVRFYNRALTPTEVSDLHVTTGG